MELPGQKNFTGDMNGSSAKEKERGGKKEKKKKTKKERKQKKEKKHNINNFGV